MGRIYTNRKQFEKSTGLKRHRNAFEANPRFRDPAHHILIRNKSHLCVHGFITDETGMRMPHAWIEHGGIVVDIFYGITLRRDEYYKVYNVSSEVKYTSSQLRKVITLKGTYGPFRDI